MAEQAGRVLPGANTRSVLHVDPFAFRVDHVDGARLVDVDGNVVVDLLGNYSAGLLGHRVDRVSAAVTDRLRDGWSLGAMSPAEASFAAAVVERFPAIEQVRFTNSGTEANLMAIQAARHATGRDRVVVFDGAYHGGLLYFGPTGAPLRAPFEWLVLDYNDPDGLVSAFDELGDEIACVLVEPMLGASGCIPATASFLDALETVTTEHGTLLVVDEVMTSRMGAGGAHGRLGIRADLVTLGKYLAGGLPVGAFGGRRDLMAAFDPAVGGLTHGGTFNNDVLSMTAGTVVGDLLADGRLLDDLFERGERLRAALLEVFATSRVPMTVSGWGSLMTLHPVAGPVRRLADLAGVDERWRLLVFHDLLEAGFYLAPRGYLALSLDVSDADLEAFVAATAEFCHRHAHLSP